MAIFQLCVPVPGSWYYTFWQGLYWDTLMEVSNWSFLLHLSFSCHDEFKYLLWKSTYLFIYLAWRQNYRYLDTHKLLIWYWFFSFFYIANIKYKTWMPIFSWSVSCDCRHMRTKPHVSLHLHIKPMLRKNGEWLKGNKACCSFSDR